MEATILEKKVEEFTHEVSLKEVEFGSDEHLDAIIEDRKPIVYLTLQLSILNKILSSIFNTEVTITENEIKVLNEVNAVNDKFYANRKNSKNYNNFKEALAEFDDESELCKETISDFINFRANSPGLLKLQATLDSL